MMETTLSAWSARRLPDENVFDRTLRGDPIAFSEVYRRYHKRIYGFCLARSLDRETAADATQEVFMRLLRAQPGSIDSPRAWLFTVARNVVIDAGRKRSRTPEDSGLDENSIAWDRLKAADTADEVLTRSDARNVFLALRTMRPRYRTALIMREIHGQSSKDMAEALESTPGAVDTLVCRARDAFGIAYAAAGDLSSGCRTAVELLYRRLGTGITEAEEITLDAHLSECERCRAEAKRAGDPGHLAALLPFLIPTQRLAGGLLHRAALTARTFHDIAVPAASTVANQPHTWNLAAKVATGLLAAALITAPVAAVSLRGMPAPRPASAASVAASGSHAGTGALRTAMASGASGTGMASAWVGAHSPGSAMATVTIGMSGPSGSRGTMTGAPRTGRVSGPGGTSTGTPRSGSSSGMGGGSSGAGATGGSAGSGTMPSKPSTGMGGRSATSGTTSAMGDTTRR